MIRTEVHIKIEDVVRLESIFAKPVGMDAEGLVYELPEWLINLRNTVERNENDHRDANS